MTKILTSNSDSPSLDVFFQKKNRLSQIIAPCGMRTHHTTALTDGQMGIATTAPIPALPVDRGGALSSRSLACRESWLGGTIFQVWLAMSGGDSPVWTKSISVGPVSELGSWFEHEKRVMVVVVPCSDEKTYRVHRSDSSSSQHLTKIHQFLVCDYN
jgi:hypothetical protein